MFNLKLPRKLWLVLTFAVVSGCATIGAPYLQDRFGPESVVDRETVALAPDQVDYWTDVKPILDNRCVACHGCYDASCQVKLTAIEGILRGASKAQIYEPARITAAEPSRLFEDAHSTAQWRDKGFYPILNEREQTPSAHIESSTMYQLLDLKERHPLPAGKILSEDFSLSITRENTCPSSAEMAKYEEKTPLWGMPYALPGLEEQKQKTLKTWIEQGARYTARAPLDPAFSTEIARWEKLLNGDSLADQLSSRYIYEHLFLAHLYFEGFSELQYFKLVRSTTPPGVPVDIISTRRPYDDPGVARPYYRLIPEFETILAKSHLPYALNDARMDNWNAWFFQNRFSVTGLPGFLPETASNPFKTFGELPIQSRYRFMLDEAQFSIMNFIKGSVCRGQVALNVIRDNFWVVFVDPDIEQNDAIDEALQMNLDAMDLPASKEDIFVPLSTWAKYANKRRRTLNERNEFLQREFGSDNPVTLDLIWDGDGNNENAALTIFRHLDSATIEKGLLGGRPKTAWLIGYPLLEQIHYLLVAGYDVYGNFGHQLVTRLYMDFLRLDGEMAFIGLIPGEQRQQEWMNWYSDGGTEVMKMMIDPALSKQPEPGIKYQTDDPLSELFDMISGKLQPVLSDRRTTEPAATGDYGRSLERLSGFRGVNTNFLAEVSYLQIVDQESTVDKNYTLLRNNSHTGITSLFRESKTLAPQENTVSLLKGLVGTYPNTFFRVLKTDLDKFVNQVLSLSSDEEYARLMDEFGVRRTDPAFWTHSDRIHFALKQEDPIEFGILDYSRIENR